MQGVAQAESMGHRVLAVSSIKTKQAVQRCSDSLFFCLDSPSPKVSPSPSLKVYPSQSPKVSQSQSRYCGVTHAPSANLNHCVSAGYLNSALVW